jgi:hypothetical protein
VKPIVLAACVAIAVPAAVPAQVVVSAQPLSFGDLIAGVAEVVSPADAIRRADVVLQGSTNGDVSVSLVLPAVLSSTNGQSIPLQFLPGDAVFQGFTGQQQPLSLTGPTTVRLHRTREANLFLGGRALPAAGQRAGHYSATVVVVLAPSGA